MGYENKKVNYMVNPNIEELIQLLTNGINNNILLIHTHCKVYYDGRAKSELKEGDRVIILKPDGTLLIHKNEKREPVNWQPPGSIISWDVKNNKLILKSVRKNQKKF